MFIYGRKSINGSVEWLGVPAPSCGTGFAWTENIFVTNSRWGDGRGYKRWAFATRSRPRFGGRSVPWRGAVPSFPNYVLGYVHLQERCLAQAQSLLRNPDLDGNESGYGSDERLDGLADKQ